MDKIISRNFTDEYRDGWDRIWGKKHHLPTCTGKSTTVKTANFLNLSEPDEYLSYEMDGHGNIVKIADR